MRRRDFIKGMAGSAAATWSLAALAQQAEQVRRIGVLMHSPSNEPGSSGAPSGVFARNAGCGLGASDAIYGSNIAGAWAIDARLFTDAKELVALEPRRHFGRCRCNRSMRCNKQPVSFRLFSHKVLIRSVTDMSIV